MPPIEKVRENASRSIPAVPVEIAQRDPLALERVRVERAELVDLGLVVPVVDGGERGSHLRGAKRRALGQARSGL